MTALLEAKAEQLRFESEALPAGERFPAYQQLYAGGADARREDGAFHASLCGFRLDRALLYDRRLTGVGHRRGPARVAADGFTHFTVTYVVDGDFRVDPDEGALLPVAPGSLVLLDMTRPMANSMRDAHVVTMSVPRQRIAATGAVVGGLHGAVLRAERAGLLGDYLLALTQRLPALSPEGARLAARPIGTLLAIALAGGAAVRPVDETERIRQLIETRLHDPRFGPAALVPLSGLSRATLYRLFQPQGGLALFIQRRRLERLRTALDDPADGRAFTDIAHAAGFGSESHASRMFHEAYGQRPGEYRAAHQPAGPPSLPVARMEQWQVEVR